MPKLTDNEQHDSEKAQNEVLSLQIKNRQITFLNGKVRQEYVIDFDLEKLGIPEIAEVFFDGLEKAGLEYFPDEKKIRGVPMIAGDHRITINFKRRDWIDGKPLLSRDITFIVNPDPKDLWKNIPTPEDIEYYKPDSDHKFLKSDRRNLVAASQRGRSHAIEAKPRDDDFALHIDGDSGWYVMAVADGAGSAKYSRRGSEIACKTAMNVCLEQLAATGEALEQQIQLYNDTNRTERGGVYDNLHKIVGQAAYEAAKEISIEAADNRRTAKEYATTLLLSVCKQFEFGWFVGAFWVGDGGIGIYSRDRQEVKILGEPDGGEFAGQTRFLTMPEIFRDRPRTRFETVEDFTAVILMTDGITDPKFETDANLNRIEKWNDLWDDLNGLNEDRTTVDFDKSNENTDEQLLQWLDFWSKGNHDDRTVAILY